MKKKIFILMLTLFVGLPFTLSLSACKDKKTDSRIALEGNMLLVESDYFVYNGKAKEPEVDVVINGSEISSSEYTITYINNVNAGIADIVVSANKNSKLITGSATTNFTINPARTNINTYESLKDMLENDNYSTITLKSDITIPAGETLTISANKTINCGNYKFINNGTIINNGEVKINVNSKEELVNAFEFATKITLKNNIDLNGNPIVIDAENRNYSIDLDLNGNSIYGYFKIYAKSTYSANVNIKNYKTDSENKNLYLSTIGVANNTKCEYGLAAMGNNINLSLFGVNLVGYYGGIATNGKYEGAKVSATKTTFKGASLELGNNSSVGAYLPGKNEYSFIDCTFEGGSAYYAKSGNHTIINSVFVANQAKYVAPTHNGSGGNATGSALIADSSEGYKTPLNLSVYNATFNSVSGYGIEEYCTGLVEDYSTTSYNGTLTFNTTKGDKYVHLDEWDGSVTPISTSSADEFKTITISTAAELAGLAKAVNSGETFEGYTIKLNRHIDLKNIEWTPIGYGSFDNNKYEVKYGYNFKGTFDAQKYTIYNLKITEFDKGSAEEGISAGVGLFGNVTAATIKNLNIINAEVQGNHWVAAVVGFGCGVTIENCHVLNANVNCIYANDEESGDKAGLILGYSSNHSGKTISVKKCSGTNSTVKADRDAGQLIGSIASNATVTENTATEVVVSWNESSVGKVDESYIKDNTNINNNIIGK